MLFRSNNHISTVLSFYFSAEPKLRPFHRPAAYQKRSRGTRSQLRHGAVRGIGDLPQQAVLRSKTAECVPLCLACQFCALVFMLLDSLYFPIFSQSHTIGIFEELCKMAGSHMVWFHNISETRADTRPDSFLRSGPVPPWTDRLVMSGKANYNKESNGYVTLRTFLQQFVFKLIDILPMRRKRTHEENITGGG